MTTSSKIVGRSVTISVNGLVVAGAKTKTMKINNNPIDITTDGASGYQTLLETDVANSSIDLSVDGLVSDAHLLTHALQRNLPVDVVVLIPQYTDVSFRALLTSFDLGFPHDNAVTFSATLKSSGAFTVSSSS